jgi:predicted AlkP superfamily phosphohydrolase/phosphomutase
MQSGRIIIVGLDGVPFGLLEELSNKGVMPNTKEIISSGIFRKMQSSVPEISSVAWSSIITGKNPGGHGIFGFTDLSSNSYQLRFPNFSDLQSEPFWNVINGKSVIVNVPSTYPVKDMNGVHISGFVSIDLSQSVFPKPLIPVLKELDYRLDVDSTLAHQSMELFLSDLEKTLHASIQTYRYLWRSVDWKIFMFVFTGTDRLMHFLWDVYEDENHKYHGPFVNHFRAIDEVIGEMLTGLSEEDLFVMLSDHGFERLDYDVYINSILRQEGFLHFDEKKELELIHINSSTKAFALDPARIYINLRGKYPNGGVDKQDKERLLRDLEALFSALEVGNRRAIKNVYRKEEIYSGPFIERAPDLVLVGGKGFNLKGNIKAEKTIGKEIFTGKHTQDDAFLLIKERMGENIVSDYPTVCDVKAIVISE